MSSSPTPLLLAVSFYYPKIAQGLLEGAKKALEEEGCEFAQISVPGILEFPASLAMARRTFRFSGAIVLGCVIQGKTDHYDIITRACFAKLQDLACDPPWPDSPWPLGVGILTCKNLEQAQERAQIPSQALAPLAKTTAKTTATPASQKNPWLKNKGYEAAKACMAMRAVQKHLAG